MTYNTDTAYQYRTAFRARGLKLARMDDAHLGYVVREDSNEVIGEIVQGYPTYKATRYSDGAERHFDSEHDWDHSAALAWVGE